MLIHITDEYEHQILNLLAAKKLLEIRENGVILFSAALMSSEWSADNAWIIDSVIPARIRKYKTEKLFPQSWEMHSLDSPEELLEYLNTSRIICVTAAYFQAHVLSKETR